MRKVEMLIYLSIFGRLLVSISQNIVFGLMQGEGARELWTQRIAE